MARRTAHTSRADGTAAMLVGTRAGLVNTVCDFTTGAVVADGPERSGTVTLASGLNAEPRRTAFFLSSG